MVKFYSFHRVLIFSVLFLASCFTLTAQDDLGLIECTNGATFPFTPENLVENILLGEGIEVTDISFEGDPQSVGFFNHAFDEIGIQRGIVMSTGQACGEQNPFGIEGVGSSFASSSMLDNVQDPDLNAISNVPTRDVCKYSISFIPTADTLRFSYVFASEEYPEFSCSAFNDVFGFFISGPGINGPFSNNGENIAIVPGTNTAVAIATVHPQDGPGCPAVNGDFYNSNLGTQLQPVYDGILDVFVAEAIVIPCEEYTIKLMIADGSDQIYDSGVFLEAKSFGTGSLEVEAATVSLDGTITEGCSDGVLTFELPSPPEDDFFIDYTIIGTAENGIDYENIPLDLFIAAGDTAVTIPIIAFEDGIDEGVESIGIDVQRDVCNRDTFWIFIRDNEIIPPELGPDTTICRLDSVQLDATLPIPLPVPPSFTNEIDFDIPSAPDIPVFSDILVFGVQPIFLQSDVIESVCINIEHKFLDDLDLFLFSPGGQFIELSTDNGQDCDNYFNTCFVPGATTNLQDIIPLGYDCAAGEQSNFVGDFAIEGVWSDLWPNDESLTNGIWQLLVIDDQQGFGGVIQDWTITFRPLYQLDYRWEPSAGLSCDDCPDPIASPDETTTYTVFVTDTYGCEVSDQITIEVQDILPSPEALCAAVTNNSITFEWDALAGASGYEVAINGGPWQNPSSDLQQVVDGLNFSDTIMLEVRGLANCNGVIDTVICWTPDCAAPTLELDVLTDVGCAGGNDGTVTVTGVGGSIGSGFVYTLGNEMNTTGEFTGLEAGTYDVIVTDPADCSNQLQIVVNEPDSLDVTIELVQEISCNSELDGSLAAVLNGGTFPYDFAWENASNDTIATGLGVGIQTVTVTDGEGCVGVAVFDLPEPDALVLSTDSTLVNCFGGDDGSATVMGIGGTGGYTYQWDINANDQMTDVASSLPAGSYTVSVEDVNGCEEVAMVIVNQPPQLEISLAGTNLDCFESNNGTATVIITGGTPDANGEYSSTWETGATDLSIADLEAGFITIEVIDDNGCVIIDSVEIMQPEEMLLTLTPTHVLCFEENNGMLETATTGGDGNYTYEWSNSETTSNIQNITADNYCVTVTDGNGCEVTGCMDITEPAELILSSQTVNAGCNGGLDGEIDLTIQGGTGMYTIDWDNGSSDEDQMGLAAGIYVVEVMDENMCTTMLSVDVADSDAIESSFSTVDVNCNGGNDGSIELEVSGGQGIFQFAWTGPNGYSSNEEDPTNIEAGDYQVVLSDAQGCSQTLNITINEPATAVEINIPTTETICFDASNGSAIVEATGGAGNYTYEWSNGDDTADATNLTAGTYTIIVTDQNGCSADGSVEIVQQNILSFGMTQEGADCFNGTNGTASIDQISYGLQAADPNDFQIQWSTGASDVLMVDNLIGGQTYFTTITDALGCTATNDITIENPAEIGAQAGIQKVVSCAQGSDGQLIANGDGGTAPYSYVWDATAGGQTDAIAIDLPAGTYNVTVTDANGCSTQTEAILTDPTPLAASFTNTPVQCNGEANGTAEVSVSGGSSPYSYLWQDGQVTAEAVNLFGGLQEISITDANGCLLEESIDIAQPDLPLTSQSDADDVTCFGDRDGVIMLFPDGGTAPYSYSTDGENFFGSSTLIAIEPGTYDVTVRDSRGCLHTVSDIFVGEPDELIINAGLDDRVEYGGELFLDAVVTGQTPGINLSYQWTWTDTTAYVATPDEEDTVIRVINPTTFTVNVVDENGCEASDAVVVFIETPRVIVVPTGFTPNGDNINDLLLVHGKSKLVQQINTYQIFDRWGEQLYEANDFFINDTGIGWDGTFAGQPMPAGVYVWFLEVEYVDGQTEVLRGETTLIR